MFCSYAASSKEHGHMDNRISEIRKVIRALRVSMREAEAIMHEQIKRDENCTFVAQEIMKMRTVMSGLVQERARLGDTDPILVSAFSYPARAGRARGASSQAVARAASGKVAARPPVGGGGGGGAGGAGRCT